MSLLHNRSSETNNESSMDVMASNASTKPQTETRTQVEPYDVVAEQRMPIAASGVGLGAFLVLLVAAWAAIIPFVGPAFGFSADGTSSWTWSDVHALGGLVPGAVGVLACLMLLASTGQPRATRSSQAFWGFILFLAGAWLTVVPVVWPVLHGAYFLGASPSRTLEYWLAYASGPGTLIAAFGTFVIGRSRSSRS
jgi:hypothetical protein